MKKRKKLVVYKDQLLVKLVVRAQPPRVKCVRVCVCACMGVCVWYFYTQKKRFIFNENKASELLSKTTGNSFLVDLPLAGVQ